MRLAGALGFEMVRTGETLEEFGDPPGIGRETGSGGDRPGDQLPESRDPS